MALKKEEFIQALVLEYFAIKLNDIVYNIHVNFKSVYIQITDTYVSIMMCDFNDIKKSKTCIIEVLTNKGDIEFNIAKTKLESIINE